MNSIHDVILYAADSRFEPDLSPMPEHRPLAFYPRVESTICTWSRRRLSSRHYLFGRSALCTSPWAWASTIFVNSCCAYPNTADHATICSDVSKAVNPGTNAARISSMPSVAVSAPLGNLRTSSAIAIPSVRAPTSRRREIAAAIVAPSSPAVATMR
jgi:hypothetical protein